MKSTTIITSIFALLGAGITTVSATCQGDQVWQDKAVARWHAERACNGYDGKQGALQGVFAPGEAKRACVPYTTTQTANFLVQNLNLGESFDLADADCVLRLHNEINDCPGRGDSEYFGWRFM